jgi:hypothetical protein
VRVSIRMPGTSEAGEQPLSYTPEPNWTRIGLTETAEEWIERIGLCVHRPRCSENESCRQKRALERQRQGKAPKVFTGQVPKSRKLDLG